jgi:hypothetical protein
MKKTQGIGGYGRTWTKTEPFLFVFFYYLFICVLYDNKTAFLIRPLINWSIGVSEETPQVSSIIAACTGGPVP